MASDAIILPAKPNALVEKPLPVDAVEASSGESTK